MFYCKKCTLVVYICLPSGRHIRQTTCAHVTTIKITSSISFLDVLYEFIYATKDNVLHPEISYDIVITYIVFLYCIRILSYYY